MKGWNKDKFLKGREKACPRSKSQYTWTSGITWNPSVLSLEPPLHSVALDKYGWRVVFCFLVDNYSFPCAETVRFCPNSIQSVNQPIEPIYLSFWMGRNPGKSRGWIWGCGVQLKSRSYLTIALYSSLCSSFSSEFVFQLYQYDTV